MIPCPLSSLNMHVMIVFYDVTEKKIIDQMLDCCKEPQPCGEKLLKAPRSVCFDGKHDFTHYFSHSGN